jgi:glutathione peroxidase
MAIYDAKIDALDGSPAALGDYRGKTLLIVNVASECGLTPQYSGLQQLHEDFGDRGFSVLGFPCNQFGAQELTSHADDEGQAGDIQWNFEKFLISGDGEVVRRFRPLTTPEDATLVAAIEEQVA